MEIWIRQHLALFFDFENFGNLNWIAILIFVYFLVTLKRRKRHEKAMVFVFILSLLVINLRSLPGYPRYHLTFFPFTIGLVFLTVWEFIKKKSHFIRTAVLFICMIAVLTNVYHFKEKYKFWWKNRITLESYYFPYDYLEFLNRMDDGDEGPLFLVCSHRNLFFYHTDKEGIDYRSPRLYALRREKSTEAIHEMIKNKLKIEYISLYWNFKPTLALAEMMRDYCDLVYQDGKFYLYRVREKEWSKSELENFFISDSLLKNGSFENWGKSAPELPDHFFVRLAEGTGEVKVDKEQKEVRVGRKSVKITGDAFNFSQNLQNFEDYRGKQLSCFVWIKTDAPNKYRVQINDGIDKSNSRTHPGKGGWELLQVNHTVNSSADLVRIRVIQALKTGTKDVAYVDGALLVEGYWNTFYLYKTQREQKKQLLNLNHQR